MVVSVSSPNGSQDMVEFSHIISQKPYTVLYFYPKDNTSGCAVEAQEFHALLAGFADRGVQIIGVSKDSHKSHCSFIEKYSLGIPLISDPEWVLHKQFGAVGEKSMYGKKYIGTIRSTFLLDNSGNVVYHWPKVQARGHAQEVLDYISTHLS